MITSRDLVFHGARTDFAYAIRLVNSVQGMDGHIRSTVALCMASHFSLFVHKSYRQAQKLDPQLAQDIAMTPDAQAIVARSRHALKLFDDTSRHLSGQLDYFGNEIIPTHRAYFIDGIRLPFLRFLGNDLGITRYDGVPIMTTHSATFMLGVEPAVTTGKQAGSFFQRIAMEYGQYFALWGTDIDDHTGSFASHMKADLLVATDVPADSEYRRRPGLPHPQRRAGRLSAAQASGPVA